MSSGMLTISTMLVESRARPSNQPALLIGWSVKRQPLCRVESGMTSNAIGPSGGVMQRRFGAWVASVHATDAAARTTSRHRQIPRCDDVLDLLRRIVRVCRRKRGPRTHPVVNHGLAHDPPRTRLRKGTGAGHDDRAPVARAGGGELGSTMASAWGGPTCRTCSEWAPSYGFVGRPYSSDFGRLRVVTVFAQQSRRARARPKRSDRTAKRTARPETTGRAGYSASTALRVHSPSYTNARLEITGNTVRGAPFFATIT
jgi:hypothetical protein